MIVGLIFLIVVLSLVIIKAADFIVIALRRLSRETRTKMFALSAFLLALSTSFPELVVGVTSALSGAPNLSLGNVIGANIANLSLVAGASTIIAGPILVQDIFTHKDVLIALLAGLAPTALIFDKTLSRVDGLILIAVYGVYASSLFKKHAQTLAEEHKKESFLYRFLREFENFEGESGREFTRLFAGIALLLFSADIIVRLAKVLADEANIPIFLVGLVILSIGTTLPELAFSIRTIEDHAPTMFLGNILGSIVANSTLIVGVAASISPIEIPSRREYLVATITFLVTLVLFWFFIRSKHRLERWEASMLLLLYLIFVVVEST